MKRFYRHTYLFILFLATAAVVAACSSDIDPAEQTADDGTVRVGLRISAAGGGEDALTRAWQDNYATNQEMMNIWTVVVVNSADDKVVAIHACKPTVESKREVDDYVNLTPGTYRFYSFANMAPSVVMHLLGIGGTGATGSEVTRADGDNNNDPTTGGSNNEDANPTKLGTDNIADKDIGKVYNIAFSETTVTEETVKAKKVNVSGNGFNAFTSSEDNGFGSYGIPMSNVQTKEITSNTNFDLIVVRMLAKIKLEIKNSTGAEVKVKKVTLSNITQNANGNLKLLPKFTTTTDADQMAVIHHGDLKENLGTATQADFSVSVNQTITDGVTVTVPFYVNECAKPQNAYGRFFLTLEIDKGSGNPNEYRYALIDDTNQDSSDEGKWDYIARNDYRIIPVVLDDYTLDIIPYDFPAIGVYPASVKNEDGLFTINFHDYGHFHLLPVVKKMSTGDIIGFNNGTPKTDGTVTWGLYNNIWSDSWSSWTDHTKASAYDNSTASSAFYRDATAAVDGDEAGGEPVWYVNDGAAGPKWAPDGTNYRPFIFGYIADPEGSLTKDRKVYHELKIQLYNGSSTTARREMLARIYMILDTDQMLYRSARRHAAPRRHH